MKKRFSIWVREHGSDHDVELCQVENDPMPTVHALHEKRLKLGKGKKNSTIRFCPVGGK
jgi:hypothetical protein